MLVKKQFTLPLNVPPHDIFMNPEMFAKTTLTKYLVKTMHHGIYVQSIDDIIKCSPMRVNVTSSDGSCTLDVMFTASGYSYQEDNYIPDAKLIKIVSKKYILQSGIFLITLKEGPPLEQLEPEHKIPIIIKKSLQSKQGERVCVAVIGKLFQPLIDEVCIVYEVTKPLPDIKLESFEIKGPKMKTLHKQLFVWKSFKEVDYKSVKPGDFICIHPLQDRTKPLVTLLSKDDIEKRSGPCDPKYALDFKVVQESSDFIIEKMTASYNNANYLLTRMAELYTDDDIANLDFLWKYYDDLRKKLK